MSKEPYLHTKEEILEYISKLIDDALINNKQVFIDMENGELKKIEIQTPVDNMTTEEKIKLVKDSGYDVFYPKPKLIIDNK